MTRTPPRRRGVTLIELMIVLAVLLVVLGSVLPSFRGAIERRAMEAAMAQWQADLQHARSLATALNRSVRVAFVHDAAQGSCYVVHTGPAAGCRCRPEGGEPAAVCTDAAQAHRVARFAAEAGLQLRANVRTMTIDEDLGTVTPTGTLRWQTASGAALNQVINLHGRVRICAPEAPQPGHKRC